MVGWEVDRSAARESGHGNRLARLSRTVRAAGVKLRRQYLVEDFPVLSAGPHRSHSRLGVRHRHGVRAAAPVVLAELMALPSEQPTVDLHCVTKCQVGTTGRCVLDVLFESRDRAGTCVHSYGV